jgi:hypothetical protein
MHLNLQMSPWCTQRPLPPRLPCGDGCAQYPFVFYLAAGIVPPAPAPLGEGQPVRRQNRTTQRESKGQNMETDRAS